MPGEFDVLDTKAGKAAYLLSRGDWFHPDNMAPTRAIALDARDGTALHGYLTTPLGAPQKALPMGVLPHDGPTGIFDSNRFEHEVQLLATAGNEGVRLNLLSSGSYTRQFCQASPLAWGENVQ